MKKSILMLAFTALVGAAFAFNGGQDGAKKECSKGKAACCKKGQSSKSCNKSDKTEAKANETKSETKPEIKK